MHKTRQDELHRYLKLIPGFYFAGMYYAYACVLVYCPPPLVCGILSTDIGFYIVHLS